MNPAFRYSIGRAPRYSLRAVRAPRAVRALRAVRCGRSGRCGRCGQYTGQHSDALCRTRTRHLHECAALAAASKAVTVTQTAAAGAAARSDPQGRCGAWPTGGGEERERVGGARGGRDDTARPPQMSVSFTSLMGSGFAKQLTRRARACQDSGSRAVRGAESVRRGEGRSQSEEERGGVSENKRGAEPVRTGEGRSQS